MAVLSVIRFNKTFGVFYDRLIANGKQTTQAQIAVMRKLIIVSHSLYKNDRRFDEDFRSEEVDLAA